jgi:hypothetical protein
MVKRGPMVDSDKVLKRRFVEEIFKNFPDGLSVRGAIKETRKRGILSSPNTILKILRELHADGILDYRMVKTGRGPMRKVYYLSFLASTIPDPSKTKRILDMRRKALSLGIEPLVEELRRSPAKYWTMQILETAKEAGVIEQLKDNADKMNFFKKLEENIGKRGANASVSLLRLTDVSFALIQSILTYAFLEETVVQHGLVDRKRWDLVKGVESACDKVGKYWARLIKEGIENSFFSTK